MCVSEHVMTCASAVNGRCTFFVPTVTYGPLIGPWHCSHIESPE